MTITLAKYSEWYINRTVRVGRNIVSAIKLGKVLIYWGVK